MLAEKIKKLEAKQDKFKEFILNTLDSLGLEKVKTNLGEIKITKSTSTIVDYRDWETDRKSTRLNSSHSAKSRMPSSA